jgi:hypothetical protein
LFPATTPLRSFQVDASVGSTAFASYSVPAVADVLRRAYARAAVAAVPATADGPSLADCFAEFAGLYRVPLHHALLSGSQATFRPAAVARARA